MPLDHDMTKEEVKTLVLKAKSGDNAAWESLYHHFEKYVHSRAWERLKKLSIAPDRKKDLEEELYQAGRDFYLPSGVMIRSRGNF